MGLDDIAQNFGGGGSGRFDSSNDGSGDKPDRVKYSKHRLHRDDLCPGCGSKGEETKHWYWRCTTPNSRCDILTYVPSGHEIDIDTD